MQIKEQHFRDGPALAAILSAAIGTFVLGINVVLADVSKGAKDFFNWYDPAGPLSGKTSVAVIVWLVSWFIFHQAWKKKEVRFTIVWGAAQLLITGGFLLTFPPIFEFIAEYF